MLKPTTSQNLHRVVIIGGGFGGLYTAKALKRAKVHVTLIDQRNFHLFQPLLYQVATAGLSPGDIASPLRSVLGRNKNTKVMMAEVTDIDSQRQKVITEGEEVPYDTLVVATGVSHDYFGNEHWRETAPGLKTVEDALEIRQRILSAFESAEKETDPEKQRAWLRFVIIGGGTTGVELAGALAELAHNTLKDEFNHIDTTKAEIFLVQGNKRLLPNYSTDLSADAEAALKRLGVTVKTSTRFTGIENNVVTWRSENGIERVPTQTVLWAAGVKASTMGEVLKNHADAELDWSGRVIVQPDLTIPNHPNIFVIGDLANFSHQDGEPLPGVAPVAMQQGKYVADLIQQRLVDNKTLSPFHYTDHGHLAVIGRHAAVVDFGFFRITGSLAWLIWSFLHIYFLIEFDSKLLVFIQWAWSYLTHKRGARLITGKHLSPQKVKKEEPARAKVPAVST
jgi:NADH dehydrogenase